MANRQITITPNDYTDLSNNISEKNIINTVTGNEFNIIEVANYPISILDNQITPTTSSGETFSASGTTITMNPQTISRLFDGLMIPHKNTKLQMQGGVNTANLYHTAYTRSEALVLYGKFRFFTSDALAPNYTKDDIACTFGITYTQYEYNTTYESATIEEDEYNVQYYTQYNHITNPNTTSTQITLENNTFLTALDSTSDVEEYKAFIPAIISGIKKVSTRCRVLTSPQYVRCTDIQYNYNNTGHTMIEIEYCILIWSCGNNVNITRGGSFSAKETMYCVDSINFTIGSNNVSTEKQTFKYQTETAKNESSYDLEDSELMLFNNTDSVQNKLSYKTATEIMQHFAKNREIISFDLLNPKKYVIDDSSVYDIASQSETRYIQENDIFTMYDEKNNLMGDFRVIQYNPVWDGAFHIYIIAIKINE